MFEMAVKIPAGVSVEAANGVLAVKGPLGELKRQYDPKVVEVKITGDSVEVSVKARRSRKSHSLANTVEAHLKNMIEGSGKKFEKRLTLVYSHFPMTVEVKGRDILIKNFLGEKNPRKLKAAGDAKVEVKGQEITVSGSDVEAVGQTASNLIKATFITRRDRRVFQDGIYYA